MAPSLGVDLGGQVRPAVGHGQDDAVDGEARVQVVADEVDGGEQLGESLECVVLALERDEDASAAVRAFTVSRPSDGGQSMRIEVVAVGDGLQEATEAALAPLDGRELDLRTGERDGRWDEVDPESVVTMIIGRAARRR